MNGLSWQKRSGFTLIELLVVLAIIGILLSILLPQLSKVREASLRAVCSSNMSQLNKAYTAYSSQNNNLLVSAETTSSNGHPPAWFLHSSYSFDTYVTQSPLYPYLNNEEVFRCPSENRDRIYNNGNYKRSYSINTSLAGRGYITDDERRYRTERVEAPATTFVFLGDADTRGKNIGAFVQGYENQWVDWPASRHGKSKTPLSFLDGHVEIYTFKDVATTQITSFWNSAGYRDRQAFLTMGHPDK